MCYGGRNSDSEQSLHWGSDSESDSEDDGYVYDDDEIWAKYYDKSYGEVRYGVEHSDVQDLSLLLGHYRWVTINLSEGDPDNEHHLGVFESDHSGENTGFLDLTLGGDSKSPSSLRGNFKLKLWGRFIKATFERLNENWETGDWKWGGEDTDDFDESAHDLLLSKELDDNGNHFLILDLWSSKNAFHWAQKMSIIGKKHKDPSVMTQQLTRQEKRRLGMGLTRKQVRKRAKGEPVEFDEESDDSGEKSHEKADFKEESDSSDSEEEWYVEDEEEYAKFYKNGEVVFGVEPSSVRDLFLLIGHYRWVCINYDEMRDLEHHVDCFRPSSSRYDLNTGFLDLSVEGDGKSPAFLRGTFELKLYGRFIKAIFKGADKDWETGKWEWTEDDTESFDEDCHDLRLSKALDDNGNHFVILHLWSNKHGCHGTQVVDIIGKKHENRSISFQGLSQEERKRLGMGFTRKQMRKKAKKQKEESGVKEELGVKKEKEMDIKKEDTDEEDVKVGQKRRARRSVNTKTKKSKTS